MGPDMPLLLSALCRSVYGSGVLRIKSAMQQQLRAGDG
jgi:hypothetical protein